VNGAIETYLKLLFKWNRAYRLTAFESLEEARSIGVEPSLALKDELPQGAEVLDVGSGGGFPAIPLALVRPDLHITCTEPSRGKAAFLREAKVHLGLNLEVEAAPVEWLLDGPSRTWQVITVRGVNLRRGLLKRLVASLPPGGLLAIWSGGEREANYADWARSGGLEVEERLIASTPPITLLLARVPRGTMGGEARPQAN
jgi:16S rRNA (guanine(527)-N(7))-methyltransferase RsmG